MQVIFTLKTENDALEAIRGDAVQGVGIRVPKVLATKWMAENRSLISDGCVFFLEIAPLGLGIYNVRKAPPSARGTKIVKVKL